MIISYKEKKRRAVIKHSSVIQSEGKMSLLQRKAYNAFIANAFSKMLEQEIHEIPLALLADYLGYECDRNDKHLKEILKTVAWKKIEYNILEKDGSETWGATTPVSFCEIKNGICRYAFSPPLRKLFSNPKIYAKIKFSIQNRFNSKYSLFLYELCLDYFIDSKGVGETPRIEVSKFRNLMGIDEHEYKRTCDFDRWVLKVAVKEINEKSDISIRLEKIKQGRKIGYFKFYITKNENYREDIFFVQQKKLEKRKKLESKKQAESQQVPIPEPAEIQTTPQPPKEEIKPQIEQQPILNEKDSQTFKILTNFNFPKEEIDILIKSHGSEKINTLSRLLEMNKNTIKNPRGWFYKGLSQGYDDWQLKEADEKKRKIEARKKTEAEKRDKEEKAERERREKLLQWKEENPEDYQLVLIECFGDLLSDKKKAIVLNSIRNKADKDKVELFESAKNHPYLKSAVNLKIEEKYLNKKQKNESEKDQKTTTKRVKIEEEKRQEQKKRPYRNRTNTGLESLGDILKK